ncbi:MAG: hypothetical protein R6X18_12155, partial [Chloroflexota bacterium]
LAKVYPQLFSTMLVPKAEELVATPYRFNGDKEKARAFFEDGFGKAFSIMRQSQNASYPMPVFYAFKQAESNNDSSDSDNGISSTGWETMLEGMIRSGFQTTATWPMRTELVTNLKKKVSALASSIVLTCLPREDDAPMATRKEFLAQLRKEIPKALRSLQQSYIAPVDLAQAVIGPGMAVYSRYSKVIEADGSRMSVRMALQIINQELDLYFTGQEGDLDADTRFCLTWFEQHAMETGPSGEAEVLATSMLISVPGLVEAGVLHSKAGKVRLIKREEYKDDWDPATDKRLTVWECTQHLVRRLDKGVSHAAELVRRLGMGRAEEARALAYRLYSICERKKWAQEALAYNSLVVAWPDILQKAKEIPGPADDLRLNL